MSLTNVVNAARVGGEPQGNLSSLPPILQGLLQQPLHRLSPEMLSLLGPMGRTPAGLISDPKLQGRPSL